MELQSSSNPSRKRKSDYDCDYNNEGFSMDDLNQDLLEKVLSWLPTSTFYRVSSVCKRWKSVSTSESFKLACSEIPNRDPCFLMVDHRLNHSIIFDSTDKTWKQLNYPSLLHNNTYMPVAASGGLVCFRNETGNFVLCNPITGSCRQLPPMEDTGPIHAIVMTKSSTSSSHSYKIVIVFGDLPKLGYRVYNSSSDSWGKDVPLGKKVDECVEIDFSEDDDDAVYFLSKAGNVVATNMHRSPSKQYSSVIVSKNGEEIVYFLSSSGIIVACNLTNGCFSEYPRLLPAFSEYSIDLVECKGEILVVLLSEFLESASVRVWRFDQETGSWQQIAAMPPAMSHEFYGKKVDINCVGAGDRIFICLNSAELYCNYLCDLVNNEWTNLPKCCMNGEAVEFMSAFSFEPRIEAAV